MASEFLHSFMDNVLYKNLIDEVSKLVTESVAQGVVFKIIKDASFDSAKENSQKIEVKDVCDLFKFVYSLHGDIDVDCKKEGENKYKIVVRNCHLGKKYGKNACLISAAMKAGIMKALTGKDVLVIADGKRLGNPNAKIVIKRIKCICNGDEECVFEAEER